ncbi:MULTISPECIES: AAA family ATPase [Bacillota]|uniref:AAA family ATPase n=2 Tax=Tissierellales TaxID=1737405 RepID=A0A943L920_FINMA|nr:MULTISPECIES: AAA family ATPase [Bacillota]MBS5965797.1 AAA family ATPase [Finegoldia magna]MDU2504225.1 AAA family ATPase [Peptoniphilus harei]MDU5508826.1 AAA family ATPase [Finegoldia magna]
MSNRSILIFDEPTSGLDFMNMKEVSNEMMRLKEGGETIFIITHNPELVESCCDYFMFMEN